VLLHPVPARRPEPLIATPSYFINHTPVPPVILFPNFPLRPAAVDPDFADEQDGARRAGFDVHLYSHEAVVAGDPARACRACPPQAPPRPALLRGWMLRDHQYAALHAALRDRGFHLLNTPDAYCQAHYLPQAYPLLAGLTPHTLWCDCPDTDEAWRLYQQLRDGDVILKDHVKSAKHRWNEACFIPAHTAEDRFREILAVFAADRDRLFEKGFVLRRYVPLMTRGRDMRGYPVAKESRLFLLDGHVLLPPTPEFSPPPATLDQFVERARRFQSRFMSMDVAQTEAGDWIIIEVGDGGVSGLPPSLITDDFFDAVRHRLGE
jgi:hypothetical protein